MRIIIDAMGGDFAPESVIKGTVEALKSFRRPKFVLVGNLDILKHQLEKHNLLNHPRVELVQADEVVEMHESSTIALRSKKNCSVTVAAKLLGSKQGDALVTIGHTGAAVAATTFKTKLLPGIKRPAISVTMPSPSGDFLLLDAGANVSCKPENLVQFAVMGEVYSRLILGIKSPRIGLLSVGDEDSKGNDLTRETFNILSKMPLNFVGNIEGNHMFEDKADIVICDGFVGNAILKTCEGMAKSTMFWLKKAFTKNAFRFTTGLLSQGALGELKAIVDVDEYGGSRLLGVNGICVIGHGASSPKAVKNAIKVAIKMVKNDVNNEIVQRLNIVNESLTNKVVK